MTDEKGNKKYNTKTEPIMVGCDRNEWPPRYFWPGDNAAPAHMVQRIRFNPYNDNRGGGGIWGGFCNNNNALSTTKQKSYIQSNFIRTQPNPKVDPEKRGADQKFSEYHYISSAKCIIM